MAVSVSNVDRHSFGDLIGISADITLDASYVTGGEPLTPKDFGLTSILLATVQPTSTGKPVRYVRPDSANPGGRLHVSSAIGTEVANGVSLAADTVPALVIGR